MHQIANLGEFLQQHRETKTAILLINSATVPAKSFHAIYLYKYATVIIILPPTARL